MGWMKYVLLPAEVGTKLNCWLLPLLQVHCWNCARETVVQSFLVAMAIFMVPGDRG